MFIFSFYSPYFIHFLESLFVEILFKSFNLNQSIQNSSFYSSHLKFAAGSRESRGRIARVTWRDRGSHVAGSRDTRGGVAGVTGRESRGRVTRVEPC